MATKASGKLNTVYIEGRNTYLRFDGLSANLRPRNGNFTLQNSHANYKEFFTLALTAAVNRYNITVLTTKDIKSTENAIIKSMWVNW